MSHWLSAFAALACSGCVTTAAIYDLVVPDPVATVTVSQPWPGTPLAWRAEFGRDPKDVGHFPTRLWLDSEGSLELPGGYERCEPLLALSDERHSRPERPAGTVERLTVRVPIAHATYGRFYGPPNELSRSQLGSECVYFVTIEESDFGHIVYLDRDGKRIGEDELPGEISILEGKRWGWLAVSPLLDAVLVPIMVIGLPATGIVMLIDAVRN